MAGGADGQGEGGVAPSVPAAVQRALELAYRYLNQRERTVQELRRHLSGRELPPAAVDAAVTELAEMGYLDDVRYARLFAEDRRRLEQWGSARIRSELLRRGIDPDLVESALDDEDAARDSADTELKRALALLQQRFPEAPRNRRDRQRALGVLVRRGYAPELAIDAISAHSRDEI